MSRPIFLLPLDGGRFPRVSGDEPATFDQIKGSWSFSPRERG